MRLVLALALTACGGTRSPAPATTADHGPIKLPETTWQLRTTGLYSHRFPDGWIVMPLSVPPGGSLVDHALIISKPISSFPDDAPLGEWILVTVVDGPPEKRPACAEHSSTTLMGSPFEVCRSSGPPYETAVSGSAGRHGFTFQYNGAARANPIVEQILLTFAVVHP
jgi:hypothetical protein